MSSHAVLWHCCLQPDINEKMRAILIDWLVEVHLKFKVRLAHHLPHFCPNTRALHFKPCFRTLQLNRHAVAHMNLLQTSYSYTVALFLHRS